MCACSPAASLYVWLCLQIVDHNSSGFGLTHLLLPLLSVCVSLSAGLLGGSLISLALQHQLHNRLAALLVGANLVGGHTSTALAYRSAQGTGVMMAGDGQGVQQGAGLFAGPMDDTAL